LNIDVIPPTTTRRTNFHRKANVLSFAVSAIVIPGLFATMALPAYAAEPSTAANHQAAAPAHATAQSFSAPVVIETASVSRDSFGATSIATLHHRAAIRLAALRVKAATPASVARTASTGTATGAPIGSLLANPPYPHFSLAQVVAVAEKYKGVPYVFGGESPAGFDCSGLVAYVYAQFGISLPHSAAAQGRIGTRIANSAARPGDVVVMSGGSHVGIYLGGNRMIDAPEPGRVVSNDAIYTSDYYIVRFGI
jgi:cell wall-associated NlpC family hydrolase